MTRIEREPLDWSEAVRETDGPEREAFLESHIDLVKYVALRISNRLPSSVELDDLIHDGILGLLDAAQRYDPLRAVRFRTYAETRVRGAILDGLRRKDWRPRSVRHMQRNLDSTLNELSALNGRAATEEEIVEALGLDAETYRSMLSDVASGPLLSLDELPPGHDPCATAETETPAHRVERAELLESLADALGGLPEREQRVLDLYYFHALNMKEVGAVLGVTESRVCQLHSQAAARLRVGLSQRLSFAGAGSRTTERG